MWFLRTISAIHIGQLKPEQVNVLARPRALIFPSLARKHAHGYTHVYPFAAHAHTRTYTQTHSEHAHQRPPRSSSLSLSKGVYCSKMLRRTDSVPSAFFFARCPEQTTPGQLPIRTGKEAGVCVLRIQHSPRWSDANRGA